MGVAKVVLLFLYLMHALMLLSRLLNTVISSKIVITATYTQSIPFLIVHTWMLVIWWDESNEIFTLLLQYLNTIGEDTKIIIDITVQKICIFIVDF